MYYDLPDLRLVAAIADSGSLTRAAAQVHLAPSSASHRLTQFEAALGVPLFARHARGLTPTAAGESLIAGTIKRNHPFVDALFNDASLFSRPLEQGFQLLVNREHYQQDLFINWNQIETFQKAERFDVGYAGRASAGFFSLNGQVYWTHSGGAQYSESRTFFGAGLPRDRPASKWSSPRPTAAVRPWARSRTTCGLRCRPTASRCVW